MLKPIAIIGQGCVLPGCNTIEQFMDTISKGDVVLSSPPPDYWRVNMGNVLGGDDGHYRPDCAFVDKGGYIRDFAKVFSSEEYHLDFLDLEEMDNLFKWSIYAAGQALKSAGAADDPKLLEKCGIIMGNFSYPTALFSQLSEELYFKKFVYKNAKETKINPYNRYMSGLPAQIIKQAFKMGGKAFALDAACASSLYALKLACDSLNNDENDLMLAGAVCAADPLLIHVGFSAISALSPTGQSRPFNEKADGLIPAEGSAFVVLKRLADAVKDGNKILGVIRGIGLSNDGKSRGFFVPSSKDQLKAIQGAYQNSSIKPEDITFLECHATGTPIGDLTEIETLKQFFGNQREITIGSQKANFGHLITVSGMAGILKVLGMFEREILPATPNAFPTIPVLTDSRFRVLDKNEHWEGINGRRIAGISSFGFGGNNAHLILEQWNSKVLNEIEVVNEKQTAKVAVVGIGIKTHKTKSLVDFNQLLYQEVELLKKPENIEELSVSMGEFSFPPSDLKKSLGQQMLIAKAVGEALEQTTSLQGDRTGVIIGTQTDPQICLYNLRLRLRDYLESVSILLDEADVNELSEKIIRPVDSAVTIGTMGNIVANRINQQHNFKGYSFAVFAEELSGDYALEIALKAIKNGELDSAVVGAVDISNEYVSQWAMEKVFKNVFDVPADAAVAIVLKSLEHAKRDQDRIYAIIDVCKKSVVNEGYDYERAENKIGNLSKVYNLSQVLGHSHAASGLLHTAAGLLLLSNGAFLFPTDKKIMPFIPQHGKRTIYITNQSMADDALLTVIKAYDGELNRKTYAVISRPVLYLYAANSISDLVNLLSENRPNLEGTFRIGILAYDYNDLRSKLDKAIRLVEEQKIQNGWQDEYMIYSSKTMEGEIAFVYSGAAASYFDMGRELALGFPECITSLSKRMTKMKKITDVIFNSQDKMKNNPFYQLCASTWLCQLHSEFSREVLCLSPDAVIGLSSGETNGILAHGVWNDLDNLFDELENSELYKRQIAANFDSVKKFWKEDAAYKVEWENWCVFAPVSKVQLLLEKEKRVYLTIISSDVECVIAGERDGCRRIINSLEGAIAVPLGHDIAVHCEAIRSIEPAWRKIHSRQTSSNVDIRFYSNYFGGVYLPDSEKVADTLTGQAFKALDFPKIVNKAWEDGVRVFVEHGPRNSLTTSIKRILNGREHLAVSLDMYHKPPLLQVYKAALELWSAGIAVDMSKFCEKQIETPEYGRDIHKPTISIPLHESLIRNRDFLISEKKSSSIIQPVNLTDQEAMVFNTQESRLLPNPPELAPTDFKFEGWRYTHMADSNKIEARGDGGEAGFKNPWLDLLLRQSQYMVEYQKQFMEDLYREDVLCQNTRNEMFWDFSGMQQQQSYTQKSPQNPEEIFGEELTEELTKKLAEELAVESKAGPRFSREQLEVLASGKISSVFGKLFEVQDNYKIQVRLPEPPLLLCDRVTGIEGEPGSMKTGTIWTETDIKKDSWYLCDGRMPTGIFIEAGQADLLLISWLGIDFQNKGKRAYRLLGCEITFYGSLPQPGETLKFQISIDGHSSQGDIRLFFFHYDCRVNGELRITARSGQAGFFTDEELKNSLGILWDAASAQYKKNPVLDIPKGYCEKISFTKKEISSIYDGDFSACRPNGFEILNSHNRTPINRVGNYHFIDEITAFQPFGGPAGRGYLAGKTRVDPKEWFFQVHFKNDPCMPGTLMAEACLQGLSLYMTFLGYTKNRDGWRFESVPEQIFKFICRGQVTPVSKEIGYEIFVDEILDGEEPVIFAHVLVTVDGLKAFCCERLGLRMVPDFIGKVDTENNTKMQSWKSMALDYDSFDFGWNSLRKMWMQNKAVEASLLLDLSISLVKQFVRKVIIINPEKISQLRKRPVIYLANHQTMVETLLFMTVMGIYMDSTIEIIAKKEHGESLFGAMVQLAKESLTESPVDLLYFDREDPEQLIHILSNLSSGAEHKSSIMVHVEGTRALSCRNPVHKISALFIDLALKLNIPIIPVRFYGGLPIDEAGRRFDFPVAFGKQDYYIGEPIFPNMLEKLTLGERINKVLEALNTLGPSIKDEKPIKGDREFEDRVLQRVENGNNSLFPAVILECLNRLPELSQETIASINFLDTGKAEALKGFNPALINIFNKLQ